MKIRAFRLAAAILVLAMGPVWLASAQEISEAASVRGHFAYGDGIWRADDFCWFYYDLDEDLGGEMLQIDLDGKTAEKGNIEYSSKVWTEQFEYEPWGNFQRVAFFGKPYFAGFPDSSFTEEVSSLEKGELREVLMDDDLTQTLSLNKTLTLQQGYVLVAQEISEKKGSVNFLLFKDGLPVNSSVVSIGESFVYKIDDLPVILVHLTNAMLGAGEGLAEVEGVFQISDEPNIRLFEGAMIGEMKLTDYS
ncbi:MAG TPA: S-layer protein domain-containing protein, partial [Methanothrix sp.]|nr:S-layer protein domain-containing protein [Methanothrix sp.]